MFLYASERYANDEPSTVGFVIGFSTFLLRCVDYSRVHSDHVTRLSDIVVERCVSRCVLPTCWCYFDYISFSQILGIHTVILPLVLCFLCVADRLVCLERYAARGHVPFLYLPPSDTRRAYFICLPPLSPNITPRRKTSRPYRGPRSFAASAPSATPILSQSYLHHLHDPALAKARS